MFSDESTFRIVNSRSVTVRRQKAMNRYKSKFTILTAKHAAGVMVWGCYQTRFIYRLLTRHDFLPVWLVADK